MSNPLYDFFTQDHRRLEELLDKATVNKYEVNEEFYHLFRIGILKHIKMEEKILFPAAQQANGGVALPLAGKLRLDHGAITSLMVVPPTQDVIKVLRIILEEHDELEEKSGGMYDACTKLTTSEASLIMENLLQSTEVPVHSYNQAAYALEAAKRALLRAGYDYDALVSAQR